MILNNAPQNQAVLSNVGEVGEFRIRNSAKAFSILSSGLYANKIRAIIRELSCNAIDSHVAAGKQDIPFDVHLPTVLEPYFSIRDYGTGLDHEQVTNIYTTYFESTKTASNEFIGALGLGSKSPFSYTDNFTVTAIKAGRKGIYTAFINEQGVPSIASMMEEATDEPAGVEVKFSVNDRWDFDKFKQEARKVYKWFKQRPVISGVTDFEFENPQYETLNIIPGVHSLNDYRHSNSTAIMGNIAYPIEIPDADKSLGDLRSLLNCGLVMEFGIGELDFQASREGLSYIPETISAIKAKLEALNAQLAVHISQEADKITNNWEKALFLAYKANSYLWTNAVRKYVTDTNFEYVSFKNNWDRLQTFKLNIEDLKNNHNILIRAFTKSNNASPCYNLKSENEHIPGATLTIIPLWRIQITKDILFVVNDAKVGALERAKYHVKESDLMKGKNAPHKLHVYVIEAYDKTKPIDVEGFKQLLATPPEQCFIQASAMLQRERVKAVSKDVTVMRLERRDSGGYHRQREMVWRDAGDTSAFSDTDACGNPLIYYYVPLSGFIMESSKGYSSGKELYEDVKSLPGLYDGDIYGVRKKDIEEIKNRKNWVNFEDYIEAKINGRDMNKVLMSLVRQRIDNADILQYNNNTIIGLLDNANSPYAELVKQFINVQKFEGSSFRVEQLFRHFAPNTELNPASLTIKYQTEFNNVNRRYPLLSKLSTYRTDAGDIAEYINLIDAKKGVE